MVLGRVFIRLIYTVGMTSGGGLSEAVRHGGGRHTKNLQGEIKKKMKRRKERKRKRKQEKEKRGEKMERKGRGEQERKMY